MSTTDVERRLAAVEAVQAIETLKHRYWRACDLKDPVAFRRCFLSRGAIIDYGPTLQFDDADDLTAVFLRVALQRDEAGRALVLDMHHGSNPDITVLDATSARGRWSLRIRQLDLARRTEKVSALEYEDGYLVEDGEWRISTTRSRVCWSITRPLTGDVVLDVPDTEVLFSHA
jgi:hypothetical protein